MEQIVSLHSDHGKTVGQSSTTSTVATNKPLVAEATLICTGFLQLKNELDATKEKLDKRDSELSECRKKLEQLKATQDNESMNRMVADKSKLGKEKGNGLSGLKRKVEKVFAELNGFVEGVKQDLEENQQANSELKISRQAELDELNDFVRNKFRAWNEDQNPLTTELENLSQTVIPLAGTSVSQTDGNLTGTTCEVVGVETSVSAPPDPPLEDLSPPENLEAIPKILHGEDPSNNFYSRHFCLCNKVYSTKQNLQSHIRKCNELGKFECPNCQEHFLRLCFLRIHLKRKHNITWDKNLVGCSECGATFNDNILLRKHQKVEHKMVFGKRPKEPRQESPQDICNRLLGNCPEANREQVDPEGNEVEYVDVDNAESQIAPPNSEMPGDCEDYEAMEIYRRIGPDFQDDVSQAESPPPQ